MEERVAVLLLEPDQWRFRGIESVLESSGQFEVVGEINFGRILSLDSAPPDLDPRVALIADRLIVDYGVSVVAHTADLFPQAAILVAGDYEATDVSVRVMAAGASGYLDLSAPPDYLLEAMSVVAEGRMWAPREAVATLARRVAAGDDPAAPSVEAPPLTDDDLLLLRYLHEGLTPRQIAGRLALTEITVKARLEKLYRGFGAKTRKQLLNAALKEGMVVG